MKILVVDNDPSVRTMLKTYLGHEEGCQVICVEDGEQALRTACECNPDMVLLDAMVTGISGWEVCRRLRNLSDVPIIILSEKCGESDIVRGLDCGADDYMAKPFSLVELKARLTAALKRARGRGPHHRHRYDDGVLYVDLRSSVIRKRGQEIILTPKEFQLLACLVRNKGRIVPHRELMNKVWGPGYETARGYLAIYIRYLRQKLEDDPSHPHYVCTRSRVGYYFRNAHDNSAA